MNTFTSSSDGVIMQDPENLQNLDDLRQTGMHDRESTQDERKKIGKRRQEIEQRRQVLARSSGSDANATEVLDLQHEVARLQERIVELQLSSDQQREIFVVLKKRANGVWRDLSMLSEESQLRLETIQGFAEAIQTLHEEVQQQEEDYEKQRRPKLT